MKVWKILLRYLTKVHGIQQCFSRSKTFGFYEISYRIVLFMTEIWCFTRISQILTLSVWIHGEACFGRPHLGRHSVLADANVGRHICIDWPFSADNIRCVCWPTLVSQQKYVGQSPPLVWRGLTDRYVMFCIVGQSTVGQSTVGQSKMGHRPR